MISLKKSKNPAHCPKLRARVRPPRPNKASRSKNPLKSLKKKRRRRAVRNDVKYLILPQLELMLLRSQVAKAKKKEKNPRYL